MKPTDGNFAENAIKHGVAGLDINGTRIQGIKGSGVWGTSNETINTDRKFNASPSMTGYRSEQNPQGRWPANIILGHSDGCKKVGTKKVKSDGHHSYKIPEGGGLYELGLKSLDDKGNPYADKDGMETVEEWECDNDCVIRLIGKMSGELHGRGEVTKPPSESHGIYSPGQFVKNAGYINDTGTANRFFKQIEQFDEREYEKDRRNTEPVVSG
jgi:hypothetical protein